MKKTLRNSTKSELINICAHRSAAELSVFLQNHMPSLETWVGSSMTIIHRQSRPHLDLVLNHLQKSGMAKAIPSLFHHAVDLEWLDVIPELSLLVPHTDVVTALDRALYADQVTCSQLLAAQLAPLSGRQAVSLTSTLRNLVAFPDEGFNQVLSHVLHCVRPDERPEVLSATLTASNLYMHPHLCELVGSHPVFGPLCPPHLDTLRQSLQHRYQDADVERIRHSMALVEAAHNKQQLTAALSGGAQPDLPSRSRKI